MVQRREWYGRNAMKVFFWKVSNLCDSVVPVVILSWVENDVIIAVKFVETAAVLD